MKKQKFLLVLSLLAMAGLWAGCSNDEAIDTQTGDGQAISFRVQGGTPTLRTTGTTAATIDAFIVWGTDNGTAGSLGTNAGGSIIFEGQTVARQQDGTFDYAPRKYFNATATTSDFYAYSPVYAAVSAFAQDAATAGFSYTAPAPNADGSTSQADLLVAKNNGLAVGATTPQTISLGFTHALSRIFVTGQNSMSEDVTVTKLELINLNATGTYDYATAAWDAPTGTETTYAYVLAESGVAVKSGVSNRTLLTSMEQGMLVIPQATTNTGAGTDFALKVTYDIANLSGEEILVKLEDGYAFAPNQQYAININFTPSAIPGLIEITFTITVTDWDNTAIEYIPPVTLSFAYGDNVVDGTIPTTPLTEEYDAALPGATFTVPAVPADGTAPSGTLEWNTKADGTGTTIAAGSNDFTVDTTLYLYDRQP